MAKPKNNKLPAEIERIRTRIILEEDSIKFPNSTDFPQSVSVDDSWNLKSFKKKFKVIIQKLDKLTIEFDFVGVDASIANALRRICLVEIPTMAVENVWIYNNTSVIPDEVLCHRLSLIPIRADPFDFNDFDENVPEDEKYTDANTLIFNLNVKNDKSLKKKKSDKEECTSIDVLSKNMIWFPAGNQEKTYSERPPCPIHDDILIAKLSVGQEIDLQVFCSKGIGKTHAKWSPVATCSYRLLPEITILKQITNEDAYNFQKCFSEGVVEVIKNKKGVSEAQIKNARIDSLSREVH